MNTTPATRALRFHWPEYLIEGWALGMFMISAGMFATLLEWPGSAAHLAIGNGSLRRVLAGIAMGLTAIALIYSPWGKRSGAHMNPAVTLAFLSLGRMQRWDAVFYVVAQCIGGTAGVFIVLTGLRDPFALPPVSYVATVPGPYGWPLALLAEAIISFVMMTTVLRASSSDRFMRYTGVFAGILVATFIAVEAPLSGMSMNPARSLASALPSHLWTKFWIYVLAPVAAMQAAVLVDQRLRGGAAVKCAKLLHAPEQRCIFCGHMPAATVAGNSTSVLRGSS